MFPFSDRISDSMQRRVVSVIQSPQFIFELPSLSTASWNMILYDGHRRERLEFLGDALIGASISEELFRCWPNEGPGFYTKARSVLTANSTFAHIMHKLGFHNMSHPVKPTGDAFETILATYHKERGPDAFNQYVRQFFLPLVNCVGHGYHDARCVTFSSK
ncbi:ribonuclease III [Pholiota conissans]|uniref:Ribonuclease III n=1 Tax=Pholiota conissans TaxID=109636 RepID=A0A9P5Z413_9AGAR|nr:ribonuclease III [Pholiota conissans]